MTAYCLYRTNTGLQVLAAITKNKRRLLKNTASGFQPLFTLHYVQFVKYDVTVSFMAQVLDTVTYLVPQVLDTAS